MTAIENEFKYSITVRAFIFLSFECSAQNAFEIGRGGNMDC